jgi:hypothetical protein
MHKFHTLQCKNNKLLLSNHHLLWCNIYTLWGSSSSVCDGEHFVLKIHKLLFDLVFKKYPSCSHPLEKYSWALPTLWSFSMSFVNATSPWADKNCVMSVKKIGGQNCIPCPYMAMHDHVHQANQNKSEGGLKFHTHSKCCRSISCCPLKLHLVMAPKASSTCMPKNTRPLAPPSFPISLDLSSSRTV